MIPVEWVGVRRPDDGELVGYLDPARPGLPLTLIGTPLRPSLDARAHLVEHGLAELDGRWFARLPAELAPGIDAAAPRPDWSWRPVVLVDASPDRCTIRLEFAEPADLRIRFALPVPVGDALRRTPPP